MTTKIKFKNNYNQMKIKEEFFREIKGESRTDQDQLAQASITIMAEKFGIDAIINKAKMMEPDENTKLQLYGRDLTQFINNKADILNLKRDLTNVFERIPAAMRKEYFNDDVVNFVDAYSSGDVKRLEVLQKYGLIHENQVENVKNHYKKIEEVNNKNFENKVAEAVKAQLANLGEVKNEKLDNKNAV